MTGVVFSVILSKGFAFVRGEVDLIAYFAHAKEFQPKTAFDTLHEGQRVEFTPVETEKGPRATAIKLC